MTIAPTALLITPQAEVIPVATLLARRFGRTYQNYHGPVLLTGGADDEGETLPLDGDKVLAMLATLADL